MTESSMSEPQPSATSLFKRSFKKSSLRSSFGPTDIATEEEATNSPAVVKATKKKPRATSRLSFGVAGEVSSGVEEVQAPARKAALGRRVVENIALRNAQSTPSENAANGSGPRYSKTYLEELRTSTPSKPVIVTDHADVEIEFGDTELSLDPAELQGATIVAEATLEESPSYIPSSLEVAEKKARRARLAQEQDYISFSDGGQGGVSSQLSLLSRKKKTESRLVRDDEDFAEGFDEFVSDGRISLGKKQERAEKRTKRAEMATLIAQAEGPGAGSGNEDDDDFSDRERREAYEDAQVGKGMDGLTRDMDRRDRNRMMGMHSSMLMKSTPLPVLSECLARFNETVAAMERDLQAKRQRAGELQKEKDEIAQREGEVQAMLELAGRKFAALKASSTGATPGAVGSAREIADEHIKSQKAVAMRGLESFGDTPSGRPALADVG